MASVNWMKLTTQRAGSLIKHNDAEERIKHEHANKDINTELTELNYTIGCSSWREACEKNSKRVAEVDAVQPPQRVRKDRVTAVSLEVPCPKAIKDKGLADAFFQKVHELYELYFGKSNVQGSVVHKDEVHEYTDKTADGSYIKKESLEHMHTLVTAYTSKKGINGKAFETRERLKGLNDGIDAMCRREFGVEFNTKETAGQKSVEALKLEGQVVDAERRLEETISKGKDATRRLKKIQDAIESVPKSEVFSQTFAKKVVLEAQSQLKAAGQEELLSSILSEAYYSTNEELGLTDGQDVADDMDDIDIAD